ncbi:amidohydrolase family protein [Syntrophus aciditrophicus]|uniref:amidohydrolase family protein n=1 Tax=Syntrophus aciditrophicus TaxID=316277 RepID=UPI0002E95764|nr:amidohydrolase family protein [Syntrophus aciditrophicus]OPY18164.1 MAG: Amidohydrolase [Syntrophus sp. PtaB.Bin075]
MPEESIVVDFHMHLINYETFQPSALGWIQKIVSQKCDYEQFSRKYSDPDAFVQLLKECGIDYAVVMAELCPITTGICPNEYVAEFCQGRPELIPFASVNPAMEFAPAERLEDLIIRFGFRGLKLYPTYQHFYPNDRKLYPLYSVAQARDIPVMLHTGSSVFQGARLKYGDPLYLDDVAVDFPRLKLLLVHSGRGFWYDRAYFLAKMHENVYMEIAGLPPHNLLKYFPELERIAHKVIYGSDWPGVADLAENLKAIRSLPLKPDQKNLILGGNALRLLNMPAKLPSFAV